jgi:hypothetical protein
LFNSHKGKNQYTENFGWKLLKQETTEQTLINWCTLTSISMQFYLQLFFYSTIKLKIALRFGWIQPSSGNCQTHYKWYTVFSVQLRWIFPKLKQFNVFILVIHSLICHLFETCNVIMCCLPHVASVFSVMCNGKLYSWFLVIINFTILIFIYFLLRHVIFCITCIDVCVVLLLCCSLQIILMCYLLCFHVCIWKHFNLGNNPSWLHWKYSVTSFDSWLRMSDCMQNM